MEERREEKVKGRKKKEKEDNEERGNIFRRSRGNCSWNARAYNASGLQTPFLVGSKVSPGLLGHKWE